MLTLNQIWIIVIAIFVLGLTLYTGSLDKALRMVHTGRHYFWLLLCLLAIVSIIIYFGYYYESSDHHGKRAEHTRNVMLGILAFAVLMAILSYWGINREASMPNSRVARREAVFNAVDVFNAIRR